MWWGDGLDMLARLRLAFRVSGTRARGNARNFYMFSWVGWGELCRWDSNVTTIPGNTFWYGARVYNGATIVLTLIVIFIDYITVKLF